MTVNNNHDNKDLLRGLFDLENQVRQTSFTAGSVIRMPKLFRGGFVQGTANETILRLGVGYVPFFQGTDQFFNTIADDTASRAVGLPKGNVLTKSLFCAFNIRHNNLHTLLRVNIRRNPNWLQLLIIYLFVNFV